MSKILYHGSEVEVKNPAFTYGRSDNDYGGGFYCTLDKKAASMWAVKKNNDGYISEYSIDLNGLNILNLNSDKYNVLHWITILIQNRGVDGVENDEALEFLYENFSLNTSSYDIITGYRADDSYFSFARDFLNDNITLETLSSSLVLGKLGEQFVLKSKKAFSSITFISSKKVKREDYYSSFKDEDENARKEYRELRKGKKSEGILITEIVKNPKLLSKYFPL